MIPLREQELIRQRFESELVGRVRIDYFTQRPSPVIVPGRQDCVHCEDVRAMLEELAHLSPRLSLAVHELAGEPKLAAELGVDKVPGIVIRGQANRAVIFSGIPAGAQFPVFIATIIEASRPAAELRPETARQLKKLRDDLDVQIFVQLACPHSPSLARIAFRFGLRSPRVKVEVVEVGEFPAVAQSLGITVTPTTVVRGRLLLPGALDEASFLRGLVNAAEGKPLSAKGFEQGPSTKIEAPRQQQARPATTPSGLILPR